MTTEKRSDEIDLIEVFFRIYIFLKKKFWVLFIATIVGAGLGYSTKFYAKPHFESSMIIKSYTISSNLLCEYIDKFQSLLFDGNYKLLQEETGISIEDLKSIEQITTEIPYDEKEKEELGYVFVLVKCSNNSILNKLSGGIQSYLDKEPFIIKEIESFKEKNTSIISHVTDEITNLTLKNGKTYSGSNEKNKINIYNGTESFYNELIFLLEEKYQREKELNYASAFRVIEDFIVYQRPVKKTTTYVIAGGFLFWFITLMFLLIRRMNKKIKNFK